MNRVKPFPVSTNDYYSNFIDDNDNYKLIHLLTLSYFGNKAYMQKNKENSANTNVYIELQDILLAHDFIKFFYDYDKPVYDNNNDNVLWVFPKVDVKKFLSKRLFDKNSTICFYYEESTLNKLILIMYGFVRYEYDNVDSNIENQIEQLNCPTLILANIYLYEKGILKLSDEKNGIGIMLDINSKKCKDIIFTNNEYRLKESIISLLNETENSNYTINDFI